MINESGRSVDGGPQPYSFLSPQDDPVLECEVQREDGRTVCAFRGPLDTRTWQRFALCLQEYAFDPRLAVSLAGLTVLDSIGLNALMGAQKRRLDDGLKLFVIVVGDNEHVNLVFEKTGLDKFYKLERGTATYTHQPVFQA